jgi:hypothetical protein
LGFCACFICSLSAELLTIFLETIGYFGRKLGY